MTRFDITRLATILRDAAQAEIMPRFRRLDSGQVRIKSEAIDLVTEAFTDDGGAKPVSVDELLGGVTWR